MKCHKLATVRGMCPSHYFQWCSRQKAYGRWEQVSIYTDAAPVRDHVNALRAAGLGLRRIEELSGVPRRTIQEVSRREPGRILKVTAAPLTAISIPATPHDEALARYRFIDPTGTIRRLQALSAAGHSMASLCKRMGYTSTVALSPLLRGERKYVTADFARRIDVLFRDLQLVPGASTRARNYAAARGWVPPLAWDEDTIDDPAAEPQRPKDLHGGTRFADRYNDIRRHKGVTDRAQIAAELGIQPESLDRQIVRYREAIAS